MSNIPQSFLATILLIITLLVLSGCQLTMMAANNSASYGEYYLTLQQLSEQQLSEEVSQQQAKIDSQSTNTSSKKFEAQIKLLLLYSLPKSPIYNSFNAKALLNQMQSESDNAAFADINPNDQAFFSLLRDQLNQRLLMRNRLLAKQQKQQQRALKQQQQLIEQVKLLEQTIKQLKNIEQAIDKRAQ